MKKRVSEMGRPCANTRMGPNRIHQVRVRGGNLKFRAMRLENGNFTWGSEGKLVILILSVISY
jgi:small subunit ribosomal protein S8e